MSGRYFIKTFGCQMNEYDSTRMGDVLAARPGLQPALTTGQRRHPADEHLLGARQGRGQGLFIAGPVAPAEGSSART